MKEKLVLNSMILTGRGNFFFIIFIIKSDKEINYVIVCCKTDGS